MTTLQTRDALGVEGEGRVICECITSVSRPPSTVDPSFFSVFVHVVLREINFYQSRE